MTVDLRRDSAQPKERVAVWWWRWLGFPSFIGAQMNTDHPFLDLTAWVLLGQIWASFRSCLVPIIFVKWTMLALLFVFEKYCLIM